MIASKKWYSPKQIVFCEIQICDNNIKVAKGSAKCWLWNALGDKQDNIRLNPHYF